MPLTLPAPCERGSLTAPPTLLPRHPLVLRRSRRSAKRLLTRDPIVPPGLPTGGLLGAKYGVRFPLLVSVGLCVVNFLMVSFVMPETLPKEKRAKQVGWVGRR